MFRTVILHYYILVDLSTCRLSLILCSHKGQHTAWTLLNFLHQSETQPCTTWQSSTIEASKNTFGSREPKVGIQNLCPVLLVSHCEDFSAKAFSFLLSHPDLLNKTPAHGYCQLAFTLNFIRGNAGSDAFQPSTGEGCLKLQLPYLFLT